MQAPKECDEHVASGSVRGARIMGCGPWSVGGMRCGACSVGRVVCGCGEASRERCGKCQACGLCRVCRVWSGAGCGARGVGCGGRPRWLRHLRGRSAPAILATFRLFRSVGARCGAWLRDKTFQIVGANCRRSAFCTYIYVKSKSFDQTKRFKLSTNCRPPLPRCAPPPPGCAFCALLRACLALRFRVPLRSAAGVARSGPFTPSSQTPGRRMAVAPPQWARCRGCAALRSALMQHMPRPRQALLRRAMPFRLDVIAEGC
jgi:hypothetical protein